MQLSGRTHLYAILAHPVGHVRAPEFFHPVFEAHGLDAALIPLHVLPEDLADVVPRLQRIGNLHGLVLTIPHK
jgi:shikimate dehydrogenase